MKSPLDTLRIHENPILDPISWEEIEEAAKGYSSLLGALRGFERNLIDAGKYGYLDKDGNLVRGGFSYGGEPVDGKPFGALHVYATRPVYQQIEDRELVADFYMERPQEEIRNLLVELLGRVPTAHYKSWLRRQELYPEIGRYCAENDPQDEQGLRTLYGEWSCAIRASAPDSNDEICSDPEEM